MTSAATALYRPDIDGLRAIAILSVVAYHVGVSGISGGFTGVDVFFVISGFLITQLLLKRLDDKGSISLAEFYSRRVRRILPCLTIVLGASAALGFLVLPPFGEKQELGRSGLAAIGFVANQYFLSTTGGYFAGPSESLPLLHLWSLSVEEQFYLVWPLIMIGIVKVSEKVARVRRIRQAILGVVFISFAVNIWLAGRDIQAAFYILPSRAWEIGVGALLATIRWPIGYRGRLGASVVGILGLGLVVSGFIALDSSARFPGYWALLPVAGTALVIVSGSVNPRSASSRILAIRPLVGIGLVSYGWYLWHWPLLSFARTQRLWRPDFPMDLGVAALSLGVSVLSLRLIENPIRHGTHLSNAKHNIVLLRGAITLTTLFVCYGALGAWGKYSPKSPLLTESQKETAPLKGTCLVQSENWDGVVIRRDCWQRPGGIHGGTRPLVVLWGDSQADAWSPAFRQINSVEGAETLEVTMAACPPLVDLVPRLGSRSALPLYGCRSFNSRVVESLQSMRARDPGRRIGVVLAARWPAYCESRGIPYRSIGSWSYDFRNSTKRQELESLRTGLSKTLAILKALEIRVLLILGQPEYRIAPIRCRSTGTNTGECDEPRQEFEVYRRAAVDTIRDVTKNFENVRAIDPIDFFCGTQFCPAFILGRIAGYDDLHVSVTAGVAYVQTIRDQIKWIGF